MPTKDLEGETGGLQENLGSVPNATLSMGLDSLKQGRKVGRSMENCPRVDLEIRHMVYHLSLWLSG